MITCLLKMVFTDALRSLRRPGVWLLLLFAFTFAFILGRCSGRKAVNATVTTFEEVISDSKEVIQSNDELLEKEY